MITPAAFFLFDVPPKGFAPSARVPDVGTREKGDVQARQPNSPKKNCSDKETDTWSVYQMSL